MRPELEKIFADDRGRGAAWRQEVRGGRGGVLETTVPLHPAHELRRAHEAAQVKAVERHHDSNHRQGPADYVHEHEHVESHKVECLLLRGAKATLLGDDFRASKGVQKVADAHEHPHAQIQGGQVD